MNPLGILFYNLAKELEMHFGIQWIRMHELGDNILSGFGFYRRKDVKMYIHDFLELRISLNPKKYEINCSNDSLYAQICSVFKMIEFQPYKLYVEFFKDLITDREMEGK